MKGGMCQQSGSQGEGLVGTDRLSDLCAIVLVS